MSARRYFYAFAAMLLLAATLVAAFNRVVDPFWYYRDISLEGFNAIKPKFRNYERHVKPSLVKREQPASLVFGSSFSEIGFDPLHPALLAKGKSYNFALAGSSWEMVACAVQFSLIHNTALRQVVIGIHPGSMPKKDCRTDIARMEVVDKRAFLFSLDAFTSSIKTVLEQHKQAPTHTADGLYYYTRGIPGTENRFRETLALSSPCKIKRVTANPSMGAAHEKSRLDVSGLGELVHKIVEKNIVVKLVVYPRHAFELERDYQCDTRLERWSALAQIVSAVEAENSRLVEVWDFEGYHEIGTEDISDAPGLNWQDSGHFNTEFGNIMLDEMFSLKQPGLGIKITSANIVSLANAEIQAREHHIQKHPEFLRQLENLLIHRDL